MSQAPRTSRQAARDFSRREMLLLAGAAAASSVVEGAGQDASPASSGRAARGPLVRLEARPAPLVIDTARTAVIVVDMQNDFGSKGGMFDLAGIDISTIQAAVAPTARVLASAREAGMKIVYLKMAFQPDLSNQSQSERAQIRSKRFGMGKTVRTPDGREGRIMIRDTWNTEILPALKPEPSDTIVHKHRFNGFYQTELDDVLKRWGVRYLVFTGCTTSVCVESTLRDAMFRDYECVVLADCTAEPIGNGLARSNQEASLLLIETSFGWVSGSPEFIARVPV